jgi:hypothetical protein
MGQSQNNSESGTTESPDRTQELTWALVDNCIDGQEFAELEDRLMNEVSARKAYLDCIQLHSELTDYFAAPKGGSAPSRLAKTPILGFLGSDSGPLTGLNTPKS